MLCPGGNKSKEKIALPSPKMGTWKEHTERLRQISTTSLDASCEPHNAGYFKVHVKAMTISRWIVCRQLPAPLIYHEWLYIGHDGVPCMYWSEKLNGLILI